MEEIDDATHKSCGFAPRRLNYCIRIPDIAMKNSSSVLLLTAVASYCCSSIVVVAAAKYGDDRRRVYDVESSSATNEEASATQNDDLMTLAAENDEEFMRALGGYGGYGGGSISEGTKMMGMVCCTKVFAKNLDLLFFRLSPSSFCVRVERKMAMGVR